MQILVHLNRELRTQVSEKSASLWSNYDSAVTRFLTCCLIFGRPFVKRFALSYRTVVCLSCLSDCSVGVWPNGWMDQDETWHAGRPRLRSHCGYSSVALQELFEIDTNSKGTRGHSCKFKKVRCTRDIARYFFRIELLIGGMRWIRVRWTHLA